MTIGNKRGEQSWSRRFTGSCICALGLQAAAESASARERNSHERARRACQGRPTPSVSVGAQNFGIATEDDQGEKEGQEKNSVHDLRDEEDPDERETGNEDDGRADSDNEPVAHVEGWTRNGDDLAFRLTALDKPKLLLRCDARVHSFRRKAEGSTDGGRSNGGLP